MMKLFQKEDSVPNINWSVWERNNIVIWTYHEIQVKLEFLLPPLSISILKETGLIGIALNYEESGSENLHIYDFSGQLVKILKAPELGEKSQFGSIKEGIQGRYEASIGYFRSGDWEDVVGDIDINTGKLIGATYRSY